MGKIERNVDAFFAKRAIAQAEINAFEEFMRKPKKTLDEYRRGIARYFSDEDWMDVFLEIINFVEHDEVELENDEKVKIDINACEPFQREWKRIAYQQHAKKIMRTGDTIAVLSSMLGGEYAGPKKRLRSLRERYELA